MTNTTTEKMSDHQRLEFALLKLEQISQMHGETRKQIERLEFIVSWYERVFDDALQLTDSILHRGDSSEEVKRRLDRLLHGVTAARAAVTELGGALPAPRYTLDDIWLRLAQATLDS